MSALLKQALESADMKEKMAANGATPFWKSPADTAAFRAAEEKRLAPMIKASGSEAE